MDKYPLDISRVYLNVLSERRLKVKESKKKISLAKIGFKHTLETRLKISEAHKGKPGNKHTEESKARLSEIAQNRAKLPKPGNPVYLYNHTTNELVKEYKSVREAARDLNAGTRTIVKYRENAKIWEMKNIK